MLEVNAMIERLKQAIARRRYAQAVRRTRAQIAPGDRIAIIRGHDVLPAVVLNVRGYAHGQTEAYVRASGDRFMGWVALEMILPEEVQDGRA